MKKPELILIDVDGTLVDSVPDLAYCVDQMQQQLGLPERGEAAVRHWVGNGVPRLVERALSGDLNGTPDSALYAQAYSIFLQLYADNVSQRSQLYPGVKQGLDWLKQQSNLQIGCITNKATQFTLPLLKDLGIYEAFGIIICGDSLPKKKPDPLPLLHAAAHFHCAPQNSLMLGDSISDLTAARAAGFQIVCVSYGYNHGEDIRLAQPDAVIDSFAELADLFNTAV